MQAGVGVAVSDDAAELVWGSELRTEPAFFLDSYGDESMRSDAILKAVSCLPRPLILYTTKVEDAEKPLNTFETLTLVPIDRRLIEMSMLTYDEISWIEIYHAKVAAALMPLVDDETRPWLAAATLPLGQG